MAARGKDLKRKVGELIKSAQAQGWTAERGSGGHWKLLAPDGKGVVFVAYSPSDQRAVKNTISMMRRYGFGTDRREDKRMANPRTGGDRKAASDFWDKANRIRRLEKLSDAEQDEAIQAMYGTLTPGAKRYVDEAARKGGAEGSPFRRNPNSTQHRELADQRVKEAEDKLADAVAAEPAEALNLYLDAIHLAAVGLQEAEHGESKGRKMQGRVQALRSKAVLVAEKAREELGRMFTSKNPADIPGGNMSTCIAIMEARPDVESPGALCNWLSQRAGERGSGGIRLPRKGGKAKKMSPALKRALRGS